MMTRWIFICCAFVFSTYLVVVPTYAQDDTAKDEFQALQEEAKFGNARAQWRLGVKHQVGEGVAKSADEAVIWWRKSAVQGFGYAQYNLGVSYLTGRGQPKDIVKAYAWLSLSAAQGDDYAQSDISILDNKMTQEQIVKALKLAITCSVNNYKNCD